MCCESQVKLVLQFIVVIAILLCYAIIPLHAVYKHFCAISIEYTDHILSFSFHLSPTIRIAIGLIYTSIK